MKKLFFSLILLIGVIVISSCSSEDKVSENQNIQDTVLMSDNYVFENSNLAALNDSILYFQGQMYGDEHTRGFLSKLWKWARVGLADAWGAGLGAFVGGCTAANASGFQPAATIIGAAVGGISLAVTASVTEANYIDRTETRGSSTSLSSLINENLTATDFFISAPASENTKLDSVGYFHNKIIMDISSSDIDNYDIDELLPSIEKLTEKETGYPFDLVTNKSVIDGILKASYDTNSLEEFCENLKKNYPDQTDIIQVIYTYIQGLGDIETSELDALQKRMYSENVYRAVGNSELNEEQKTIIKSAVNVGYASMKLWNKDAFSR